MLFNDLAEDVLRVIISQLLLIGTKYQRNLAKLASTSRRMRAICAPILFSRCVTRCDGKESSLPQSIRPFIQHLIYLGQLIPEYEDRFGRELPHLPHLRSVTFRGNNLSSIPWTAFKRCISLPNITSVTFEVTTSYLGIHPFPAHDIEDLPLALTTFTYDTQIWRIHRNDPHRAFTHLDEYPEPAKLPSLFAVEYLSLSPLVLRTHATLQSLTLPIEIAPLDRMVRLPWPQLRELHLSGQMPCKVSQTLLRDLVTALPRLATLSVQCARRNAQGRLSLLGPLPYHGEALELRSLTLAYPDPNDAVFDVSCTSLTELSLRDQPRYYFHLAFSEVANRWCAPILSTAECLSILRRMEMPKLHTLELVYETDGDDDELLTHVSRSFPRLMHLELHRYRKDRCQVVPHAHLARILASITSLRTVNLNLDFHDDVEMYDEYKVDRSPYNRATDMRGEELARIFEACPSLEYVALLVHGIDRSTWAQYHPQRCAEPRLTVGCIDSPTFPHPIDL